MKSSIADLIEELISAKIAEAEDNGDWGTAREAKQAKGALDKALSSLQKKPDFEVTSGGMVHTKK